MSTKPSSTCAQWSIEEEKMLIAFMTEHKAQGEGSNFKEATFQACARELAKHPCKGASKGWKSCQDKWRRVV
jgi:hypothetical protein